MKFYLQSKKEIRILMIVFMSLATVMITSQLFDLYHIRTMNKITVDIYQHPLNVSNAALRIKAEIYQMHLDIKDVLLADSKEKLYKHIADIDTEEQLVNHDLKIIENNILGNEGKNLEQETANLFKEWKPIRDEVIGLVKNNHRAEAIALSSTINDEYVLKLENSSSKLYQYSRAKAAHLKYDSITIFKQFFMTNLIIGIAFLILFFTIAYYTIARISRYILRNEHLTTVLAVIREINQLVVREKNPQALIQECCDILVSDHVYGNAWIVLYGDGNCIEYMASSDTSKNFSRFKKRVEDGWVPHCVEKTNAQNENHILIESTARSCPECPLTDIYASKAAFTIQLKYNEHVYGYLTLSVDNQYLNDKEEFSLLQEVAGDISYALYNLQMQQSLKESEERHRFAIEATNDGIWDWNIITNKVYFSPRWKELLGYGDDEMKNAYEEWETRLHPADKAQTFTDIQEAQNGKSGIYEGYYRLKHKDGHWVWIKAKGQILRDEYGQAIRMVGSHTDITKEKEHEAALIHLQELYGNIIDSVDNIIFVKDTEFRYIVCNQAFEKFVGKSKGEIIGKNDYDLFAKEVADFFRMHDETMMAEKRSKSNFEWVTYPDGRKVYLMTVKSPLMDSANNLLGLVGNSADLTEQKRAEDALEISNDKFEKAFNQTPNMILISHLVTGRIYDVNKTFEQITGYRRDEVVGKTTMDINVWTDIDHRESFLNVLNENGSIEGRIYTFRIKNGNMIITRVYASLVTINNEKYVLAVADDITEEYKAKIALNESEERFKLMMRQSPAVIELYDMNGLQIEVNHAYEELWGFPAEQTLNKFNLFESEEIKNNGLIAYVRRAYAGEAVTVPTYEYDSSGLTEAAGHGRKRWLNTRIYPIKDSSGNVKNIVITHEDVTEKRDSFQQLEQKKRELETIFQEAPNPIMLHNEEGKVLMVNKVWESLTGYRYDEIDTIDKWVEKACENKKPLLKDNLENMYCLEQKTDLGESSITTKSGDTIIWQFSSAPLGIIDGKRTVVTSAMDVTELKRKDELMMVQSRHAAMGEMIGMIAHQWRQPIAGIAMDANNMLLDIALETFDSTSAEGYAQDILDQTKHLSKTIDDFRNFFKPDKSVSKVKLRNIMEETLTIVKESLVNHRIDYTTEYASDSLVDAYPRELMQVFVNLINNAKDSLLTANPKKPLIEIKVYEDDAYVNTEICDNGIGINDEIFPKLFDPYFTTKDEKTGTGLGLYMSKMIIEEHLHGFIEASNNEYGACFRVRLLKKTDKSPSVNEEIQ